MSEHIQVAEADGIVTITLNRPDKLNAFIGHMRRDLAEALEHAGSDRSVRRVILAIRQMTKPVIASINGPASGAGCNLALACDLRIAANNATFSQSFAKVGLHPDWGGTYFLPRLVTPNKACELFFLGDSIDANEAARLGIVNQVVAPEELENATMQLAQRLRAAPPIALAAAKHAVYLSQAAELEEMLRFETEAQLRCFESDDGHEGVQAFLEKREPKFTGH